VIRADFLPQLATWAADWQAGSANAWSAERFEAAQAQLLAWQLQHIPAFAAFARYREPVAGQPPFVPVTAFKSTNLAADYVPDDSPVEFHTSGTSDGQPGRVRLSDTRAYDVSLLAGFHHFVLPEPGLRLRCVSLVPTDAARPHSSLGHMARLLIQNVGDGQGGSFLDAQLDLEGLRNALREAIADDVPVLVLATSLAIQAWMDAWPSGEKLALPVGSRLMDTGGPKGRTQLTDRDAQHAWLVATLGFIPELLVGEFGMTELATPRYETTLRAHVLGDVPALRAYAGPPWLRTLVLNPATQHPVPHGETGMLAHIDLANLDSPAFLLTADLGRAIALAHGQTAIELLGRVPGSDWRGCGLDVESLLAEMRA
jgi:hypothetical protein